jgi:hypothetical protein
LVMTSQKRKTRMPVASADSPKRALGPSPCMRATGRPRKIVAPAIAPSRRMCAVDMTRLCVLVRAPPCKGSLTRRLAGNIAMCPQPATR